MSEPILLMAEEGPVTLLTLNRPDKLNALNRALLAEVGRTVSELTARPIASRPRAVILTGAGDKAFAAGADVAELSSLGVEAARSLSEHGQRVGRVLEEAPFPIIAAVNGFALGGGCELALACDFIHASDKARFGQPEVALGLVPGFGGTQRLLRRVGVGRARELVTSGRTVDAAEAKAIGLANEVHPHAELLDRVKSLANTISEKAPLAVAAAKRLLLRGESLDLTAGCALETEAFGALFASHDAKEGTSAFVAKRKPAFDGT
jgi:enoyl-CoA hydratase